MEDSAGAEGLGAEVVTGEMAELDTGIEVLRYPVADGIVAADGDAQLKPMEWMPMEQPEGAPLPGLKVTLFAPAHWEFGRMEPPAAHEWLCVHTEPSGMWNSQSMLVSCEADTWK